jgi:hypothetical protein
VLLLCVLVATSTTTSVSMLLFNHKIKGRKDITIKLKDEQSAGGSPHNPSYLGG